MATIEDMAEDFWGFGRWNTDYWFLGPEQGMAQVGDGLELRCRCWDNLSRGELVDCIAYHRCLGYTSFHEPPYRLQPTWRRLIRLLLAFKGELPLQRTIRAYQATKWGISGEDGETCVIDLSALAAPNLKTQRDRESFREHRVSILRERIAWHKPRFIVMYGLTNKAQFEQIAGGRFGSDGICECETTVVMLTPAPTAFGHTDDDWDEFGLRLRQRCDAVGLKRKVSTELFDN